MMSSDFSGIVEHSPTFRPCLWWRTDLGFASVRAQGLVPTIEQRNG